MPGLTPWPPNVSMTWTDSQQLGSETARAGFRNEADVVDRFNAWQTDAMAQAWLARMGYTVDEIEWVTAAKIPGSHKADVQVQVTIQLTSVIGVENLQVKLVSQAAGFNQIDKRWVSTYTELWQMPPTIETLFKRFTGEIEPTGETRDARRTFADEFTATERDCLLAFLEQNRTLIITDILKGRGRFSAEWLLVILKHDGHERWTLEPMNVVLNFFGHGPIEITARGSIRIGQITVQRKGGDNGRDSAKMLQFKINPALLFEMRDPTGRPVGT